MIGKTRMSLAAFAAALGVLITAAPPAAAGASPVIVSGTLHRADGAPASSGQTVLLIAWPDASTLKGLADGQTVPTLVAGTAQTDSSGAFFLRYSDPAAVAEYADVNGVVNFTVESMSGGLSTFGVSRQLSVGSADEPATRATDKVAPQRASDAPSVQLKPVPGSTYPDVAGKTAAAASGCGWAKLSTIGPRWVQVGEGYTTTGVSATFTYTSGSSSTLGMGVSSSGTSGTFSASGSTTVSSTLDIGMTPISAVSGRYWRTQFVYSRFGYACLGTGYINYQVRATSFAGGAQNVTTTAVPSVPYCTPQPAGSHVTRSTSTASTFAAGAGLSGDIGINLSAQTGFTSTAKITYTFAAAHNLCGANGYPGGSPGRLAAKP